jgi:cysteine desulfurase
LQRHFAGRVVLNGHPDYCLPNTLNIAFPGFIGSEILNRLDGVAASTGSACHAGRVELSPTLAAMGIDPLVGMGAIRFSLGRGTTAEEIEAVLERLVVATPA